VLPLTCYLPIMSLIFRRGIASMAPLKKASKVVCIGRNYAYVYIPLSSLLTQFLFWQFANKDNCRDHVTELNNQRPKQPFFFLKPASSILSPGTGPVIRPKGVDLHYEVELALILGKQVKNLEASDEKGALDSIESSYHIFTLERSADWNRLCSEH
jgi:acylpyruvate hydrolase